jgi:hypothetical protein
MLEQRITPQFALVNRAEIEREIERLIGILDAIDAPIEDLEPEDDLCLAGDDGCGFHRAGSLAGWGANEDIFPLSPQYGIDQSLGPINHEEGYRAWQRTLT